MHSKPLVSIIINCFNGEKYLDYAIQSVLKQSYKNWEIIFFDNNSTDKSFSILRNYKDKRIRYFKLNKTQTLYKARNLAVKKSKGKLISFLDVDDWWKKDKLKKQVSYFVNNKKIEIIYSNIYLFSEKKNKIKKFIKGKLKSGYLSQKLINNYQLPILSSVIKKKIFSQIKFDNRYTIIGDFDFFVRLSLKKKIFAIQEPLAYYRIHSSNLTHQKIDLNIRELARWLKEKKKDKNFKMIDFSKIEDRIEILKVQENYLKKNYFKLIFLILKNILRLLKFKVQDTFA